MLIGYNTNGFAFHRLEEALEIIAELGYRSAALTLDHHALNPFEPGFERACEATRRRLERLGLASVVETGARFLLDPRRKHEPTLVSPDAAGRARRLDFLQRAVEAAAILESRAVSFWTGRLHQDVPPERAREWLVDACRHLADFACRRGVKLALEPEPGMLVATLTQGTDLLRAVDHPALGLTVDLGHLEVNGEVPISTHLAGVASRVVNVHIEDARRGVHEHLFFGEGEMDFADVFRGLTRLAPETPVHVELSRHSADAVETARRAMEFLRRFAPG